MQCVSAANIITKQEKLSVVLLPRSKHRRNHADNKLSNFRLLCLNADELRLEFIDQTSVRSESIASSEF